MADDTMQRMRAHITKNEKEIPTPYKDNKGKLTVGTGFKVEDEQSFVAMPFKIMDTKTGELRPATEAEKKAEFQRANGLSNKELTSETGKSQLSLSEADIRRRLDSEITTRIEKIKGEVGAENWDRLTPGQQTAVLDVHYANGSLENYPTLKDGIKTGDAKKIGENVDFHSGGARNWERLARNRAEAQEISFEEAQRQIEADRKAGKFDLPVKPEPADLSKMRPEPRPQPEAPQVPEPTPEPEIQPQSVPISEQKKSEPPADPKVAAMAEMAGTPIANPGRSALLKPVEKLTQSEMTDMIHSAQADYRGTRSGDPLKAHTYERVQDWHANIYGDQPQGNDGGKPIELMPIRPIPEQPSPHTTPQGEDLWQATARIGRQVANAAGSDGYTQAVTGLQRGLNMLGEANPLPNRSPAYAPYTKLGPVDEDGQYGPQTDFALKHATARLGPNKVDEAFALGRFNTFARNAQRGGNAEGLEDKTHSLFGPLFRGASDGKAPKVEGGVLQETLNSFGQDLKVDNWVGPKTTEAFNTVLREHDSDDVTRSFGRGLGFL
ncbi:MAG: hypothetical protein AB7G62_12680 [Magnetospirillum sp.]